MKAKVTKQFDGQPDNAYVPRTFAVGEEVTGDLARVAIENGWAEDAKPAPAKPAAKKPEAKKASK